MVKELFNPMELDALGEMMNISLGSSATAVSNMLDHRVDITTPKVSVVAVEDFELGNLEPAMGVQIRYVEGLDGGNIMLLRRSDVKKIVDILLGSETADEDFELNELTISAVCEVMNQMMGSAATAMSDFLGFPVNISTPEAFEIKSLEQFKESQFPPDADMIVVVRFLLKIEGILESEFMNVISIPLAKELLKGFGLGDDETSHHIPMLQENPIADRKMSQEDIEKMMAGMNAPAASPAQPQAETGDRKMSQEDIEKMMAGMNAPAASLAQPQAETGDRKMSQEDIEKMLAGMNAPVAAPAQPQVMSQAAPQTAPQPAQSMQPPVPSYGYPPMEGGYMPYPYYPGYAYPPQMMQNPAEPKVISAAPYRMQEMPISANLGKEQSENLDLIMEVPLQVTVEIGRTRRKVQDILEFSKGSLVVLDKLAGDQVDLFVNGKCIARGDVVVVDDNFGVRITEIVSGGAVVESAIKKK